MICELVNDVIGSHNNVTKVEWLLAAMAEMSDF